ncbi:MAG: DUF4290 domain-containing protein [Saprospiraceae bacterium]|nr:DUF4290 domain-containing protein [Saprospiraceae bacterium]
MKKDKKAIPEMAYNTQQEFLIMPEYGRNVQQLVRHAQKIEDPAFRQQFCEQIVDLIQQLYPQSKSVEDYREKLWKHLFQIAKYNLEARTPSGLIPRPEDAKKRPDRVPYPQSDTRFKHYGNNIQRLIRRAIEMESGPIKDGFVQTIGSYMKLAYKTWNREHYVNDDIIKTDLDILSNGKLSLEENSRIDGLSNAQRNRNRDARDNRNGSNTSSRDNRSSNNNNSRDNRNSNSGRDNRGDNSGRGGSNIGGRDNRDNRGGSNMGRDNRNNNNNNNNNRKRK